MEDQSKKCPIGVFDSGFGGLTVFRAIKALMPEYDYLYFGDNARAPYGDRPKETIYEFTLDCVKQLFDRNSPLVILACNTATSNALPQIQQLDLPKIDPTKRVLGVIQPTIEALPEYTKNGHIGVLGTPGTCASHFYEDEIVKSFPTYSVVSQAGDMFVPLVELGEYAGGGADYFVKKYVDLLLAKDHQIDTIVLGCTHYPLLYPKIRAYVPSNIQVIAQGDIVAKSLKNYLKRHPEMDNRLSKNGTVQYFTSEGSDTFDKLGSIFMNETIHSVHVDE